MEHPAEEILRSLGVSSNAVASATSARADEERVGDDHNDVSTGETDI